MKWLQVIKGIKERFEQGSFQFLHLKYFLHLFPGNSLNCISLLSRSMSTHNIRRQEQVPTPVISEKNFKGYPRLELQAYCKKGEVLTCAALAFLHKRKSNMNIGYTIYLPFPFSRRYQHWHVRDRHMLSLQKTKEEDNFEVAGI